MSEKTPARALRIYLMLAHAFPHEFKMVYGADVIQLGEDVVEDIAREHGRMGLIRLIADIGLRVPVEYLSEMRRDMVYAVRGLIKAPGFAAVGILSLGLGIGVTTSVFSTLWAQMFRPIEGVAQPAELAIGQGAVPYEYIEKYREQHSLLAGAAAFQNGVPFNVAFPDSAMKPQRVFGHLVGPEYFSVLGAKPQRGRLLNAQQDKPGEAPVVVISDRFWRERLGADAGAVGSRLLLNGQTATIVGIAPKGFNGALPIVPAELFVPVTVPATLAPELAGDILHKRDARAFVPLLRMAPGVKVTAAEAGLDAVTRHLDEEGVAANAPSRDDKTRRVTLLDGGTQVPVPRQLRPVLVGFYSMMVGLILTIACMNLATMLLARGAARRKELAIRLAVGASRMRLVRQMVSESLLLSLAGGALGLMLAIWLARLTSQLRLPIAVPVNLNYGLDWNAAWFTLLLSIVCGLGFSLAPALQATRADVAPTLKEGAVAQLRGYKRFGMRNLLVLGQVAGSLMLLLLMGFFVIGFQKLGAPQVRFDANTMYLMSIDPVRDGYSAEKAQALFEALPERLKTVGAVRAVALAEQAPFSIVGGSSALSSFGGSAEEAHVLKSVAQDTIGAGYFAALNQPLLAGREFEDRDQRIDVEKSGVALPVMLSQTAATGLFPKQDPLGREVKLAGKRYLVVGLVPDLKTGVPTGESSAMMYLPLTRENFLHPPPGGMTIMVRSDAGADALTGVRREIARLDPNLAVFNIETLNDHLELSRAYLRLGLDMYGGIGLFGLVLASIGLAGVTAYAVARRRKEIGIRMALGARRGQVLRLVLREGTALVIAGTVLGLLGAVGMARVLSSLAEVFVNAFKVSTNDPRLLIGAPLLLAALAMIACYIPARRSSKVDPLRALREE